MKGVVQQIPLGDILELLGNSLDAQVAYVGADLRYRFANYAYQANHAKPLVNLRGKSMLEILGRESFEAIKPYVDAALKGDSSEFEIVRRHPITGKRSIIGKIAADTHPDGSANGFLEILRDVTEGRRRAQVDHEKRAERIRFEQAIKSSEKRFRTMVDQSPLSIQIFDSTGRCIHWNDSWKRLWRAKPEQLEKYNILADSQFKSLRLDSLISRGLTGETIDIPTFEYDPPKSGLAGRPRWVKAFMYPIQAEENARETVLTVQDVTEEREAQLELQATKERLQLIVSTSLDAVITIDADDRITGWEGQSSLVFGWTRDEVLDQELYETIVPENARSGSITGMYGFLTEGGRPIQNRKFSIDLLHKNGHTFAAEVAISAAKQGGQTFYTVFVRDIQDRVQAEEDLRQLNIELEERVASRTLELQSSNKDLADAYRELETFSYSVAHDLRNPLRRLSAVASIMQADGVSLGSETHEKLEAIKGFTRDMTRLIEDHLNFAKFSKTNLALEKVDFSALAWAVLRDARGAFPDLDVRVRVLPSLKVMADPQLLRVVLENLVDNAAKFTQQVVSPCIEIGTLPKQPDRVFYIRDNGVGFDSKFSDKLFLPFERLHREEEYGGTGVGLFNAKRIIDRHGGKIFAESSPGNGATFYFTLGKAGT